MNTIKTFQNPQLGSVKCWMTNDGKIFFLANDLANGLGYSSGRAMTRTLDDDEKGVQILHTPGGNQEVTVITESGFYHAAMKARVEKAKAFRKWVTAEVLPQIRKTGGYIPVQKEDDEKTILCKAMLIYKRTVEEKDALLEAQRPLVNFANAITSSEDSILIRDLAKLLTQNGFPIGGKRMFKWLRDHGYLFQKETRPIQHWVEKGIFDTNMSIIETNHGSMERVTTKVTGKGQEYFVNGFLTGRFSLGS